MSIESQKLADNVASTSLKLYNSLPNTAKPNKLNSEWTLLAAIVLESGEGMKVVSLGSGSKCIGKIKMSPLGDILNDSHAEIMARRGLLRYLYDQVKLMHNNNKSEVFSNVDSNTHKCVLKRDVKFHLFVSHTPCGDASIIPKTEGKRKSSGEDNSATKVLKLETEIVSKTAPDLSLNDSYVDTTLNPECSKLIKNDVFRTGAKCVPGSLQDLKLPGADYHRLSAVRTKPGRGDPTLSLSCSDKICRWCVVGVQGALLSILIDRPLYLSSVVIASSCPFSEQAMHRALISRISQDIEYPTPFSFHPPKILKSNLPFLDGEKTGRPCPTSMVWCALSNSDKLIEVAVEGKRQGVIKKLINTPVAQLKICKLSLFREFISIVEMLGANDKLMMEKQEDFKKLSYLELKSKAIDYQITWQIMKKCCFPEWPTKPEIFVQFKAFD